MRIIPILFFTLYSLLRANAIIDNSTTLQNKLETSECYNLKDEVSCDNNAKCAWCKNAGWNTYSCYEAIDNCDCVQQENYDDCIQIPNCHYCNLGAYGGRYCISKDVECG